MSNNQKTPLDIIQNDDGSLIVQLPITYEMAGSVKQSFSSQDELKQAVSDPSYVETLRDLLPEQPDFYIDGSFKINTEHLDNILDSSLT